MTDQKRAARWECHCKSPPFLLGTYTDDGKVMIKLRDRTYEANAPVRTRCPLCSLEHVLAFDDEGNPIAA